METTALNPRQSLMNRTMVISKRCPRRPKLPDALAVPNSGEIMQKNVDKNMHTKKDTKFAENFTADFAELEQILRDNSVNDEISEQILETANLKAKQWKEALEKCEEDKLMEGQLYELKLNAASKNSTKAIELFKILAEHGIDIDAILIARSANSIQWHVPSQSRASQSPNGETETKLMRENDALNGEINSLEENYSNLFKLYEKTKLNCVNLKEVEQSLNAQLEQMERKYSALHKMYMELLVEAQKKLGNANEELKHSEREHEQKTLSIRLALKRAQIRVGSLETALELKAKENAELHSICDQLIEAREQFDQIGPTPIAEENESPRKNSRNKFYK